ncbi:MAG: hypothetical protein Q8R15_02440 [Candidatus Micrarchaeota archaeon]|nr:hypothetical protein [Candidatus Micrarchaeota archaeon]
MAGSSGLQNIKDVVKGAALRTAEPLQPKKQGAAPTKMPEGFFTGAISRGSENVLGQATRAEYINEFIDFWTGDYRAKAKCLAFLALAVVTWNWFAPFALFSVALAAKYWDLAMWNRNISRFNGHFRTVIYGQ